ncbi:MAG: PKD domain-containing protein, partial [bacterium]
APACRVMPLKVANSAGSMYFSAIVNAIYHAADNGADIISMSLGAAISSDPSTDSAIQYAHNAGVTILAATGNENNSTISYPAINTYVIGVGAASPCGDRKRSSSLSSECNPGVYTDPHGYTCDGERWWGSNYGSTTPDAAGAVDILGPTILPTTDIGGSGGYRSGDYEPFFNGTSCATPYVAGVCGLIKSKNPAWTPAQVRNQLVTTAIDIVNVESGSGWDRYSGYGMVDAEAAVGGGGPTPPVAAFTGSPTSGDAPLTVYFTDQSTGSPTSWSWNFGDQGTSSAQNPSHTYTSSGTYTVTLTVSNAYGSDNEVKTNYITVTEPGSGYAALPYSTGFESGSFDAYWTTFSSGYGRILITTANTPHSGSRHMTMDNSTSGSYSQNEAWLHLNLAGKTDVELDFWWKDFGDETHTQDGVYFSSNGGSSFVKVYNLPGGSYSNNVWNNFTLDVDQLAASAGLSLTSTFVIKFQQYDNYPIATDGFAFDDITVTEATLQPPVAAFSGDPTAGTAPLEVQFADESTGAATWSWSFGDQGTSTAQNPSHTYTSPGTYTVSLTVTNAAGSDTETKTNYITVSEAGGWTVITYDDFESGWGSYSDGGADCARYTGGTYAWQGMAAIDIQDNSGTASSFYHAGGHNVTGYNTLEVEFYFVAISMEYGEDFWVQYYNGSSWYTVASYARGYDFNNSTWYVATVTIPRSQYTFPSNARIRFMCDASGDYDDVYIDQITFRGTASVFTAEPALAVRERSGVLPGMESGGAPEADETALLQNYPNPFNPSTSIAFSLVEPANVRIDIFNVAGQRVATLVNERRDAGWHRVEFDASGLSTGIYFCRLTAGDFVQVKKMSLMK